jgi:hypothetical protein
MTIEDKLDRIIELLEKILGALERAKPEEVVREEVKVEPITEPQKNYIRVLRSRGKIEISDEEIERLTKAEASELIDRATRKEIG